MDFTDYGVPAPEWEDFVRAHPEEGVPAHLPADDPDEKIQSDINDARRQHSERDFRAQALADQVRIEDAEVRKQGEDGQDRLAARVYTKVLGADDLELDKVPAVVYFHGGGYVFGTPDTEQHLCSLVASRLRVVVVHIVYREAPQHRHPAAHRDGKDGFEWVWANAGRLGVDREQIVIVGLSCGAGIAASTALRVCNEDAGEDDRMSASPPKKRKRLPGHEKVPQDQNQNQKGGADEGEDGITPGHKVVDRYGSSDAEGKKGRIKGMLLGFPWLLQESSFPYHRYRPREAASRVQCAEAPCMSKQVYDRQVEMLGAEDPADPLLNVPLAKYTELARFPRTAFIVAGMDMFRDDGLLFAEKLKALG